MALLTFLRCVLQRRNALLNLTALLSVTVVAIFVNPAAMVTMFLHCCPFLFSPYSHAVALLFHWPCSSCISEGCDVGLEVTGNISEVGNIAEILGECQIWESLQDSIMSWARTRPVLIPGLLPSASAAEDPATVLELVRGLTAGQTTGHSVQQKDPSSESTSSGDMTMYLFHRDINVI